jgi:hypothetical protein
MGNHGRPFFHRPVTLLQACRSDIARKPHQGGSAMPSLGQVTFVGASGKKYVFEIYDLNTTFKDDFEAVYIFARRTNVGTYIPVYIGETEQLGIRIRAHDKWPCIRRNSATHICIHGTLIWFPDAQKNETLSKITIRLAIWNRFYRLCRYSSQNPIGQPIGVGERVRDFTLGAGSRGPESLTANFN